MGGGFVNDNIGKRIKYVIKFLKLFNY
ncbi:MAG: hypothetical protein ACOCWK_08785 [Tangfeifania sp.]